MESTKQRGGKRTGSGRPKGEPTRNIQFRVPEKYADWLKIEIKKFIKSLI